MLLKILSQYLLWSDRWWRGSG